MGGHYFKFENPNPGSFERKVFGTPYVPVDTNCDQAKAGNTPRELV